MSRKRAILSETHPDCIRAIVRELRLDNDLDLQHSAPLVEALVRNPTLSASRLAYLVDQFAPLPPDADPANFVAIDFETADAYRDSACSVAIVRVEGTEVTARAHRLIRPPRPEMTNSHIHGITWEQVRDQPAFGQVWPDIDYLLQGISFVAAHNAGFDRSVLGTCCEAAGLVVPTIPFRCTVQLARRAWRLRPTKLPDVARHLGLPLKHHDALSDAEACAGIVIAARQEGLEL